MIGTVVEKVWGTTQCLLATPMFELHRLTIKPFHRCSLHIHQFEVEISFTCSMVCCTSIKCKAISTKLGARSRIRR